MKRQLQDSEKLNWIVPDWEVSTKVRAMSSTRLGGFSASPYNELNLAGHVGDEDDAVAANRRLIKSELHLPAEPAWLNQLHGNEIVDAKDVGKNNAADASFSFNQRVVCAVLTADCLPVLLCSRSGSVVAAVHVGWRGLLGGIIEKSVNRLKLVDRDLVAWLGPAISVSHFEVGAEVREQFLRADVRFLPGFVRNHRQKWCLNLVKIAHIQLENLDVGDIYGGKWCTFDQEERFFSYRRSGRTGRMASLIWIE